MYSFSCFSLWRTFCNGAVDELLDVVALLEARLPPPPQQGWRVPSGNDKLNEVPFNPDGVRRLPLEKRVKDSTRAARLTLRRLQRQS